MNFKIGDRVRIRGWDDMVSEFGTTPNGRILTSKMIYFIRDMEHMCGREYTICGFSGESGERIVLLSNFFEDYFIVPGMLELVETVDVDTFVAPPLKEFIG